jgi:hypothetical protein
MSFLDATGLGTFWGKLKNYFVPKTNFEAPVTGLSDILTPVNLIPNSDYSISNGWPKTINISSITTEPNINRYNRIKIYNGLYLMIANCKLENAVITISTNNIHITGTVTNTFDTYKPYLGIRTEKLFNGHITFAGKIKNNLSSLYGKCQSLTTSDIGTITVIKRENLDLEDNSYARSYLAGTGNANFAPVFALILTELTTVGSSSAVDFNVCDTVLYDGIFVDTPNFTSHDVKPSNIFMLSDYSNSVQYLRGGTSSPVGRMRVLNLGAARLGQVYLEFLMIKTFRVYMEMTYKVRIIYGHDANTYTNGIYHLDAEFVRAGSNNTNRIPSCQLVLGSDNNIYFCITSSYDIGGEIVIIPGLTYMHGYAGTGYTKFDRLTDANCVFNATLDTDGTVLKTVNFTELT